MKKFCFIIFSMLFLCAHSFAHESPNFYLFIETDSTMVADNGDLLPLTIKLKNESDAPFSGSLVLKNSNGVKLIGQAASAIELGANSQKFIPVRMSIGKSVPAGKSRLQFVLLDNNNALKTQFQSTLTVRSKRQVQLSVQNPNQLMENVGDSLKISILIANQGNNDETITITAAFPDLRGGKKVEKKQIELAAFQDTIVSFRKIITRALLRVERYSVNVAALYDDGELINNVIVKVQNVSGSRTFVDPTQRFGYSTYSDNFIELGGTNLFSQSEALQLEARNQYNLMDGRLETSVNGYFYTHGSSRPLLNNTYIDYQKNGVGVTVGNISESLETFVNGRGVKAYMENEESTKLFEVGWADKTYNLLGDEFSNKNGFGYTTYAKTELATKREGEYKANIVYDRDPLNNSENIIAMNDYSYELKENVRLGFDLGGGLTRLLKSEEDNAYKPSFAAGANLSGQFGDYSLYSNNFYSSGYYPGVRRGVLQLNQRLSRRFKRTNLWASFTMYRYNPKHLRTNYTYYAANNSNTRFQVGVNFPLARFLNVSFAAKKLSDEGFVGFGTTERSKTTMKSFRLSESINWRSRNSLHGISLSAENGFSEIPFADKRKLQLRVNGNYNFRFITISSYYQQGDFTVMEAYRNAREEIDNYRFNVSGSVRKDFFNRKLKTSLNVSYNKDSYSGTGMSYSGRVDYQVFPQFTCFTNVYMYSYNNSGGSTFNTNFQAGIRYNLPSAGAEKKGKRGNLKLFLFYDNNVNGVFDEADTPAEDRIVNIENVSFITNAKGVIEYKKMPHGEYSLKVPSQDWVAIIPSSIYIDQRRTTLDVPLQRTGKVKGKLYYKYDVRTSEQFDEKYGGLRMWAHSTKGNKIEALTNANGEFTLYLPIGEYVISVDANSLPKNVYTNFKPQVVKVDADQTVVIPEIELQIKQRKIEIKRFGS